MIAEKKNNLKVTGEAKGELEVKRLSLIGVCVELICTGCNEKVVIDFSKGDYLDYPKMNEWYDDVIYCSNCDLETEVKYKLNISLECELNNE